MITAKQYTETFNRYRAMLRENAERISKSSEVRKDLIKNAADGSLLDMLISSVNCIADLTGDECFRKSVIQNLERRKTAK